MADAPAVPPADQPAPVVEQPIVAPAVVEAPVVVAEAAPVETPVVEEKPVEAAPERTPSLLEAAEAPGQKDAEKVAEGDQPKDIKAEEKPAEAEKVADAPATEKPPEQKAEEKPAEEKKDGEAPAEEKPAEKPALEAVEYEYAVPEQITMDEARRGQFNTALDAFRADPAKGAQGLIDMHMEALRDYDKQATQRQWDAFNDTKKGWRDQVMADEIIGGSGHRTAMAVVAQARNAFVSDAPFGSKEYRADMAEFVKALDDTGAGEHPAILKFVYRVGQRMNEPAAPHVLDIKMPKGGANPKGGSDSMYDNPRSPQNRQ